MERFKFINQTDGPTGRITFRRDKKAIRTHVMRHHWATEDEEVRQQVALMPEKVQKTTTKLESLRFFDDHEALLQDAITSSTISTVWNNSSQSYDSSTDGASTRTAESPSRHFNRATDAFIYAGTSIDVKSYGFFNHYSSEFQIGLCAPIQPIPTPQTSICCAVAVQENSLALLHAICFTAAMHQAASAGDQPHSPWEIIKGHRTPSKVQHEAMSHKSIALTQLNRLLTQNPDRITEATILCVTVLLLTEAIFGDVAALTVHSNGLRQITQIFGGEAVLSPAAATVLSLTDVKAAAVLQTQPSFPLRPYVRHKSDHMSAESLPSPNLTLQALGSRFFSAPLSSRISYPLRQCLLHTRHLIIAAEQRKSAGHDFSTSSIDDFAALEHRLLSLPSETILSKLEECLRFSLLLYSNLALFKTPTYFGWVAVLVGKLKSSLVALGLQNQGMDVQQLLLWMLFLGAHAADDQDVAWWTSRLQAVMQTSGVTQWLEAVDLLEDFFYVESVCGWSWGRIWSAAMSGVEGFKLEPLSAKHPCNYFG